jgi:beta-lactamase regulating signal transducer with metallopeptidase domain
VNLSRPAHTAEVPRARAVDPQNSTSGESAIVTDVPEADGAAVESAPIHEVARVITGAHLEPVRVSWWQRLARYWPAAVAGAWASGTVVHLFRVAASVARLRRLTRRASPVDANTLARARELARQLGLRRCPRVLYVDGPISPMLCAIGVSPRLLLPAELWFRLDAGQRDTVLTHELAHLKRGDHWVRALEVLVAAIYWWHPAVWWARRALREATEQCCDAWVLWALPRSAASYATALIEAIDFISTARPAVPALASGMGQFTDLKRRLVMIKRGNAGKALTWPAFGAVCMLGGLVLPLAPSFGQAAIETTPVTSSSTPEAAQPAAAPVATATAALTSAATTPNGLAAPAVAPATPEAAENVAIETRSTVDDPRAVSSARREVERLRAQLARAEERLARLEGGGANRADIGIGSSLPDGHAALQPHGRVMAGRGSDERAAMSRLGAVALDNQQQRLDALEGQVREILNELRQMKRDQRGRSRDSGDAQAK